MTELLEAHRNCDRAERDSRTKDEFLAMLAHELRNPLGAIGAAAQVLEVTQRRGRQPRARRDRAAGPPHLPSDRDLLDIERVVSGKIRLNRQPLDLAEAVRRVVATFLVMPRLDRHIDVSTEPAWVDGDAVRMEQVLTNIVTNAVKYTPADGRICVALCADGADAVLTVEDSGFGISPELLPFIFDMYVQADQTLDRARGGLGIGLALVRRLVELHGGTVTARARARGTAAVTIRLKQILSAETSAGAPFRRNVARGPGVCC